MRAESMCLSCIVAKQASLIRQEAVDETTKSRYMREVLELLAASDPASSAPVLTALLQPLYESYFHKEDPYQQIKRRFNAHLLARADGLEAAVAASKDPLHRAICLARGGNYIDSASEELPSEEKLTELLQRAMDERLPEETYQALRMDLRAGRNLLYITDNAGEIVLDMLCIRQLRRDYPELEVTAMVRGGPALNDATMEDARQVGLTDCCRVIDSGVRLAGADMARISQSARREVEKAGVIIAKGQANFECLGGTGLPIYYSFLCKCRMFTQRFGLAAYTGVFLQEKDIGDMAEQEIRPKNMD